MHSFSYKNHTHKTLSMISSLGFCKKGWKWVDKSIQYTNLSTFECLEFSMLKMFFKIKIWRNKAIEHLKYMRRNGSIEIILKFYDNVCVLLLSHVWLFVTPWTIARQATLSMAFPRQEYWSGLLFPFPGDLPNPGIEPRSPALQAGSLPSKPQGKPLWYVLSAKE